MIQIADHKRRKTNTRKTKKENWGTMTTEESIELKTSKKIGLEFP